MARPNQLDMAPRGTKNEQSGFRFHHQPTLTFHIISESWFIPTLVCFVLMSSAKSYVLPIKLTCGDHLTRDIIINGISLFKLKRTVEANHLFPGIYKESQTKCKHTFHPANGTYPAECLLSFSGRKLPSDLMIIAVYRCVAADNPQKQIVRISE